MQVDYSVGMYLLVNVLAEGAASGVKCFPPLIFTHVPLACTSGVSFLRFAIGHSSSCIR